MNLGVSTLEETVTKSDRIEARQSFFLEFAEAIRRDLPGLPLMVTGGFRSRAAMEEALSEDGCDLLGLGRLRGHGPSMPEARPAQPQSNE
jgi:2,4-dienoyl-CoA reductase-like NADH-dependent reductase (Old Yellow Enzyme family)